MKQWCRWIQSLMYASIRVILVSNSSIKHTLWKSLKEVKVLNSESNYYTLSTLATKSLVLLITCVVWIWVQCMTSFEPRVHVNVRCWVQQCMTNFEHFSWIHVSWYWVQCSDVPTILYQCAKRIRQQSLFSHYFILIEICFFSHIYII